MTDLITPEMALKAAMRQWLQADASRLAACYWWPTHEMRDAKVEIRLALLRKTKWIEMPPEWREFADEVLQEAIDGLEAVHEASGRAVAEATAQALRNGSDRRSAVAAALQVARQCAPMPPPWLVTQSIEKAAKEHRFETKFWQRRRAG